MRWEDTIPSMRLLLLLCAVKCGCKVKTCTDWHSLNAKSDEQEITFNSNKLKWKIVRTTRTQYTRIDLRIDLWKMHCIVVLSVSSARYPFGVCILYDKRADTAFYSLKPNCFNVEIKKNVSKNEKNEKNVNHSCWYAQWRACMRTHHNNCVSWVNIFTENTTFYLFYFIFTILSAL